MSHRAQTTLTQFCRLLPSVWARRNTATRFLSCTRDHKHWHFFTKKWSADSPDTTWGRACTYKVLVLQEVLTQTGFTGEHRLLRRDTSLLYHRPLQLIRSSYNPGGLEEGLPELWKAAFSLLPRLPLPSRQHTASQTGAQFSHIHCSRMVLSGRYRLG